MGQTIGYHVRRESVEEATKGRAGKPHVPTSQHRIGRGRRQRHGYDRQQVDPDEQAERWGERRSDQCEQETRGVDLQVYAGRRIQGPADEGVETVGQCVGSPGDEPRRLCEVVGVRSEEMLRDTRERRPEGKDAQQEVHNDDKRRGCQPTAAHEARPDADQTVKPQRATSLQRSASSYKSSSA
jgi:hypothetical protein